MRKLPNNWLNTELDTLFELYYGKGLRTKELLDEGYNVYGANGVIGKYSSFNEELEKVIISCRGAASGAIHKTIPKSFVTSNSIILDEYSRELIELNYVMYAMRSIDKTSVITGTAQPQITIQLLKDLKFPLPPLAEQQRIVAKLDDLFGHLEQVKTRLEKIPGLLKNFRQAILTQAVTGQLTEEWRVGKELDEAYFNAIESSHLQKKKPVKVRGKKGFNEEVNLFEIPEIWKWIPNYKLTVDGGNAICAGPFGTIFKAKDFRTEGIPIIFLRHVKPEGFNQRKPNYMEPSVWEEFHQEYSIYGGELLITKLGDPPGDATIFPKDFGVAMVTPDVMKANYNDEIFNTKYASYFFNSTICKDLITKVSFGMTRLRIDLTMFKSFQIPVPSMEEQTEIVKRVESLFTKADAIEAKYNTLKTQIDSLPQAILAKAFKGELVEQLPTDGNAADLLKEIQKLKAEIKSKGNKKKSK